MSKNHEAVVLGGGPAGAAAAILLARRSHDVALVRPAITPAGALAESIPPSARKLFGELALLEALETSGFFPNGGNTVWWADQPARSENFVAGASGFHVDRRGLEDVLVASAESIGVHVYDGWSARSAVEDNKGWQIRCDSAGEAVELRARWLLDATGRHGFMSREMGRQPDRSTTTLALVARWDHDGWDADTRSHTLIQSYTDGWAWSVPLSKRTRCFTAMIDQRHAELEGKDVRSMLIKELDKAPRIGAHLSGARPVGDAWACPASLYTSDSFARPGLLLVGDAGSFIDPLSSFGVKKALSSGWLAGIVVHTALTDPDMTPSAVSFFDDREREVYRSYRRLSAEFFEEAADTYGHEYWVRRARAARSAGGRTEAIPGDPDRVLPPEVPEEAVRAAYEVLRGRERLGAVKGSSVRTLERPAIEGLRIVLDRHLASDEYPRGLRFVRGVDLRHVVDQATRHDDVAELWATYNGIGTPVALPDFLAALATAFAAGLLEHEIS